jgi:membrane-associated phospholipid phosphatase
LLARYRRALPILIAVTCIHARNARAQESDAERLKTFYHASDLAWTGAFALGSLAISRFDPAIAKYFQEPRNQADAGLHVTADVFTHLHETTLTLGGLATYGIARLVHGGRDVQEIGLHAAEAVATASITSQVIRGPLGRARPKDASPIFEDQYEFHWFDGFRNFRYRSYPSIHASSAFAVATVVVAETHYRSPGSTWLVAPIAYGIAAGPCYARMYLGQHWASDILMGAFFGSFYGSRIVSYAHHHPDNKFDRFFLGPRKSSGISVVPGRGWIDISYGFEF